MDAFQDVEANNEKQIAKSYPIAPGGIGNGYMVDRQGALAFAFTGDPQGFLTLHRFSEGAWQKTPVDLDAIDVLGAGDQPDEIVVLAPRTGGKPRSLSRMDVKTGELREVLIQDKRYDVDGVLYRDEFTREILGVSYHRAGPQTVWFDETYRNAQKVLDASFPK